VRLTRVFVPSPLSGLATLRLPEGPSGHLARVLRLEVGAALTLFDGRGGEYDGTITAIAKQGVSVAIGAHQAIERESPLAITLLQGISRGERMDLIVQKATELGVTQIRPLRALRSSVRLDADTAARKQEHWQAVAASACEQCGRNRLPQVQAPLGVAEACQTDAGGLKLMLAVDGARPLAALLQAAGERIGQGVTLLVGPEGGLDPVEEAAALRAGFCSTLLGPRVLRTETAPLAALAALQTLAGDFAA
jgi:16S rRNA (uracil1498-N3)-methyltransferase